METWCIEIQRNSDNYLQPSTLPLFNYWTSFQCRWHDCAAASRPMGSRRRQRRRRRRRLRQAWGGRVGRAHINNVMRRPPATAVPSALIMARDRQVIRPASWRLLAVALSPAAPSAVWRPTSRRGLRREDDRFTELVAASISRPSVRFFANNRVGEALLSRSGVAYSRQEAVCFFS